MKFFEGCVALITGASSGLGKEFAYQLAPVASVLILVARRQDRLETLRTHLLAQYPNCSIYIYLADLVDEKERLQLATWLQEQQISLNLLVNNAGLGDHGEFSTSEWARIHAMLAVNIAALTHLTYLLLPSLLPAHRAAILNVSSVAGFFPLPHTAIYCATKAYVTSFSEALAMELAPKGIRVTALCPGPVPTEFSQVAARSTEIRPHHADLMPMFVASPGQVVKTGLRAVAEGKACVIPNLLLAFAVRTALLIPFDFTRKVISYFRMSL